jgi:hypothetical protein
LPGFGAGAGGKIGCGARIRIGWEASRERGEFAGNEPRHRPAGRTLPLHCEFPIFLGFIRMAGLGSFLTSASADGGKRKWPEFAAAQTA